MEMPNVLSHVTWGGWLVQIYEIVIENEIMKMYSLKDASTLDALIQSFISVPHKNIRKPLVLWCFQGLYNGNIGQKGVSS